jgi:Domain of unknown function (DUF4157)
MSSHAAPAGPVHQPPAPAAGTRATGTPAAGSHAAGPLRRLQTAIGNQAMARIVTPRRDAGEVIRWSPGRPLEAAARADMEQRFGEDLGSVRVHTDPAASGAVGAAAYTIGEHIVFNSSAYAPHRPTGRALLAHELAHVLQQRHNASGSAPARLEGEASRISRATASGNAPVTVRERGRVGLARQEDPDQPQALEPAERETEDGRRAVFLGNVRVLTYTPPEGTGVFAWRFTFGEGRSIYMAVARTPNTDARIDFDGVATLKDRGYTLYPLERILEPPGGLGERPGPRLVTPPPRPRPRPAPRPAAKPAATASDKAQPVLPPLPLPPLPLPPAAEPAIGAEAPGQAQTTSDQPAAAGGQPPPPPAGPQTVPPQTVPPQTEMQAPAAPLAPTTGQALVDEFTHWRNLDEEALGARLAEYARQGMFGVVNETLDEVDSTDRDDLSLAMAAAMKDADLDAMLRTPEGKALNLRMYDELTSGFSGGDEQAQADRLLQARYRAVSPMATASSRLKTIPFEGIGFTKFDSASLEVRRLDDGRIMVRSFMRGSSDRFFARNLSPGFMAGLPEVFDPDEIIEVYLVDEDRTIHVPAMFLLQLSNQESTRALTMMGESFFAGLTLGAGSEAGAVDVAAETAGTRTLAARLLAGAGRVLTVADRVAQGVGVAGEIINDHRGLIIRTFGEDGRKGLEIWSKIETITAVYGAARGIFALVQLAAGMKSALSRWRALRAAKDLPAEDAQALDATIAQADQALQEIEKTAQEQNIDLSGPAANDNAGAPLPPQPPVAAQHPVMRMDDINIMGRAANDNEEALALASGDRPRASIGGGTGSGGGGKKPGTPPAGPKATAPSTPSRPPVRRRPAGSGGSRTTPQKPLSLAGEEEDLDLSLTEQIEEDQRATQGLAEQRVLDPSPEMTESELSKERGIQPGHLPEGTVAEDKELLRRGLTREDKVPWQPGPEIFKDPNFAKIVGLPEYTDEGELVGVILDGPGLELKSGSSVLTSTYQLRLMVYRSQLLHEPLELCTSRPIAAAFRQWLVRYGVKITLLKQ